MNDQDSGSVESQNASDAADSIVEAKPSAEALAAELARVRGLVAEIEQCSATAKAALAMVEEAKTASAEAKTRAETLRDEADQSAQLAAQRSQHIEDGMKYVNAKRKEIDDFANAAQQSAADAEAQLDASRTSAQNLTTMEEAAKEHSGTIKQAAAAVELLHAQCKEHLEAAEGLAGIAEDTEQRIKDYEDRLQKLEEEAAASLKRINELLPGATSAGLAAAFNERRAHFKWPQRAWQVIFFGCIAALLGLATLEFRLFVDPDSLDGLRTWDSLGLSLLHRLPFALPLIWLALHAAHKAALAQRIEEDYAFKETVSRSFEGYKREMEELAEQAAPDSALSRLCSGVLRIVTDPPGRLYDKQRLNQTPLNAMTDSAEQAARHAAKAAGRPG